MKDNEPMSSLTHFIGALLSVAALTLLVVFAARYGNPWHIVSFSIFGASLILLYTASTIYHIIPVSHKAKLFFRKIDHTMVYILIAGTYTAVCLTVLRGGWGWTIFGIIWGLACIGTVIKYLGYWKKGWLSALPYIAMGWLIIIAIVPLAKALPSDAFLWLVLGGILYTVGTIFFGLESIVPRKRWWGMHEIFHIFVLLGSFSHFWLLFRYVVFL